MAMKIHPSKKPGERRRIASSSIITRFGKSHPRTMEFVGLVRRARAKVDSVLGPRSLYYVSEGLSGWRKELGFAAHELLKMKKKKGKVKFLAIGPGRGNYLQKLVSEVDGVEVHSISPESIPHKGWEHHIGTIEGYNLAKLGQFDFIHAKQSVPWHSAFPSESIEKIAYCLRRGGKAILNVKGSITDETSVQKLLGRDFKVEHSFPSYIEIERKR